MLLSSKAFKTCFTQKKVLRLNTKPLIRIKGHGLFPLKGSMNMGFGGQNQILLGLECNLQKLKKDLGKIWKRPVLIKTNENNSAKN